MTTRLWSLKELVTALMVTLGAGACRGPANTQDLLGDSDVVTCTRCQTVWVAGSDISYTYEDASYDAEPIHQCQDCRYAVENYFATGKWVHTCGVCGEGLQRCEARRP